MKVTVLGSSALFSKTEYFAASLVISNWTSGLFVAAKTRKDPFKSPSTNSLANHSISLFFMQNIQFRMYLWADYPDSGPTAPKGFSFCAKHDSTPDHQAKLIGNI